MMVPNKTQKKTKTHTVRHQSTLRQPRKRGKALPSLKLKHHLPRRKSLRKVAKRYRLTKIPLHCKTLPRKRRRKWRVLPPKTQSNPDLILSKAKPRAKPRAKLKVKPQAKLQSRLLQFKSKPKLLPLKTTMIEMNMALKQLTRKVKATLKTYVLSGATSMSNSRTMLLQTRLISPIKKYLLLLLKGPLQPTCKDSNRH